MQALTARGRMAIHVLPRTSIGGWCPNFAPWDKIIVIGFELPQLIFAAAFWLFVGILLGHAIYWKASPKDILQGISELGAPVGMTQQGSTQFVQDAVKNLAGGVQSAANKGLSSLGLPSGIQAAATGALSNLESKVSRAVAKVRAAPVTSWLRAKLTAAWQWLKGLWGRLSPAQQQQVEQAVEGGTQQAMSKASLRVKQAAPPARVYPTPQQVASVFRTNITALCPRVVRQASNSAVTLTKPLSVIAPRVATASLGELRSAYEQQRKKHLITYIVVVVLIVILVQVTGAYFT